MAGLAQYSRNCKKSGLLSRYSDSLGEMMLRKYTERAIRAARAEAELNSRAKSAFLSTMSHELRTPLNAIIGFSDLIAKPGAAQDQAGEYASHIANAGRRLLAVVSDVMDMSKLEAGALILDKAPLNISDVIEAALSQTRDAFTAKKQSVTINADAGLPLVDGDGVRLRQLLVNLLSNAGKFTGEGGRILILARAAAEGSITIAVADTGSGMTHEQIVTALKPFSQIQSHLVRNQEGAGLGLPIAMGLARLHGGSLFIDSRPGAGTTAVVTLPAMAGAAGTDRSAPAQKGQAA
ncbi:MAG: HAMP domain-containing histidine kinase [Alphaproteobacteria bacterium]|nr:HAMP domain-containing histidine kinase [Alphaproteobacteria bacterium]